MTDRGACLVRGWTAAVFGTSAAALSHMMTGGVALHPVLVLFSLTISALVCVAVPGCVPSLKTLATVVVASERLLPLALQALRRQPGSGVGPGRGEYGGVVIAGMAPTRPSMGHLAGHHFGMWFSPAAAIAQILGFRCYGQGSAARMLAAPLRESIRPIDSAEQGKPRHHRLPAGELWYLSLKL